MSERSLPFFRRGYPGLEGSLQLDFHGRGTEGEKGGKSEPQMPTQARQRGKGPATRHLAHPSASKTEEDQVGLNGCTSFRHFKEEAQHVTTIHVQRTGKPPLHPLSEVGTRQSQSFAHPWGDRGALPSQALVLCICDLVYFKLSGRDT